MVIGMREANLGIAIHNWYTQALFNVDTSFASERRKEVMGWVYKGTTMKLSEMRFYKCINIIKLMHTSLTTNNSKNPLSMVYGIDATTTLNTINLHSKPTILNPQLKNSNLQCTFVNCF